MPGEPERMRKTLRELGKLLESLPADPAPRKVHKLRTASRRVQALAAVLERVHPKRSRRLIKAIEPVRRAAGGVRDMDVLMALARRLDRSGAPGSLDHLLAYLENARQQHASELMCVLHDRHKAVLKQLKQYAKNLPSIPKPAKKGPRAQRKPYREEIHAMATSIVRELGAYRHFDAENLHDFRLKIKALRYTLQLDENAENDLVAALGDVQRRIGDWHDRQQLAEIAREVLRLEKDQTLVERIEGNARRKYDRAIAAAYALRQKYLAMPLAVGA